MIFFSTCSSFSVSTMDSTLKLMGFKVYKQGRRLIVHEIFPDFKEGVHKIDLGIASKSRFDSRKNNEKNTFHNREGAFPVH